MNCNLIKLYIARVDCALIDVKFDLNCARSAFWLLLFLQQQHQSFHKKESTTKQNPFSLHQLQFQASSSYTYFCLKFIYKRENHKQKGE